MEMDALEAVVRWLKDSKKTVALTGPELSMESGLPDFAGESFNPHISEFWENRDVRAAYWKKLHEIYPKLVSAKPNPAHEAISELGMLGYIEYLFTQAADGLHRQFEVPPVIELNCSIQWVDCSECGTNRSIEAILSQLEKGAELPICETCGKDRMKPPISFPGQPMPHWELREAWMQLHNCDVFLAVGAFLDRQPVSGFPALAKEQGAKIVIISQRESPADDFADAVVYGKPSQVMPYLLDKVKEDIEYS